MTVCMIGTGYVGLVSGTCFADTGATVICVDNDESKLNQLNQGKSPIYEPGLTELIQKNMALGTLSFTSDLVHAISQSRLIFIAVGTPTGDDGSINTDYVTTAVSDIIQCIKHLSDNVKRTLVMKSTVPVGTTRRMTNLCRAQGLAENQVALLSNPEFLREGSAVYDFFHPDRIVIGYQDDEALAALEALYTPIHRDHRPVVAVSFESSELSKYAANAFLATKITFVNEIAKLCEQVGATIKDITKIMGMDGRISNYFLHSGPGYGGSCFPKDVKGLIHTCQTEGVPSPFFEQVDLTNDHHQSRCVTEIKRYFNQSLAHKRIAILGLSFKPNTDDIRCSSSLRIIDLLLAEDANVTVYDPAAMDHVKAAYFDRLSYAPDVYTCTNQADCVVVATEWNMMRQLDLAKIYAQVRTPFFVDLRNLYSPHELKIVGFDSFVIGNVSEYANQLCKNV